jgi:hypothetical protein
MSCACVAPVPQGACEPHEAAGCMLHTAPGHRAHAGQEGARVGRGKLAVSLVDSIETSRAPLYKCSDASSAVTGEESAVMLTRDQAHVTKLTAPARAVRPAAEQPVPGQLLQHLRRGAVLPGVCGRVRRLRQGAGGHGQVLALQPHPRLRRQGAPALPCPNPTLTASATTPARRAAAAHAPAPLFELFQASLQALSNMPVTHGCARRARARKTWPTCPWRWTESMGEHVGCGVSAGALHGSDFRA